MEWRDISKPLWATQPAIGPTDLFLKFPGLGRGLMLAQLIQLFNKSLRLGLHFLTYEVVI